MVPSDFTARVLYCYADEQECIQSFATMNLDFYVTFNKKFTLSEAIEDADDLSETLLAIRIGNPDLQSLLKYVGNKPKI